MIVCWYKTDSCSFQNQNRFLEYKLTVSIANFQNRISFLWRLTLLFRKYLDLQCEVLLFVSWLGQMVYFQSFTPIFEMKCEKILVCMKRNIIQWKVLEQFLCNCCNASNSFVHCAQSFVFSCMATQY